MGFFNSVARGLVIGACLSSSIALPAIYDEGLSVDLAPLPGFTDIGALPIGVSEVRGSLGSLDPFDPFVFSLPANADRLVITQSLRDTAFSETPSEVVWAYDVKLQTAGFVEIAAGVQDMSIAGAQVLFDQLVAPEQTGVPLTFVQSLADNRVKPAGTQASWDYTLTFQVLEESHAVPLPAAGLMLGCGLIGGCLAGMRRRS